MKQHWFTHPPLPIFPERLQRERAPPPSPALPGKTKGAREGSPGQRQIAAAPKAQIAAAPKAWGCAAAHVALCADAPSLPREGMEQYAFFSSGPSVSGGLADGGLEEGIDAPPEEVTFGSLEDEVDMGPSDDYSLAALLGAPRDQSQRRAPPKMMSLDDIEGDRATSHGGGGLGGVPGPPQPVRLPPGFFGFNGAAAQPPPMPTPAMPQQDLKSLLQPPMPPQPVVAQRPPQREEEAAPAVRLVKRGENLAKVVRQPDRNDRAPPPRQARGPSPQRSRGRQFPGGHNDRPAHHWYSSTVMTKSEIDTLLRIQWASTHAGRPYYEDYCYLAALKKSGELKGKFSPIEMFDGGDERKKRVGHVNLEGLGKIPLGNVRRPKPLMDLSKDTDGRVGAGGKAGGGGDGEEAAGSDQKTLDQEPMLAARVMIEDGMNLLLDVDDVDRIVGDRDLQADDVEHLERRRAVLLERIARSFLLPEDSSPILEEPEGDSVFLYLANLQKGQKLIARFLRSNKKVEGYTYQIVWSILRNMKLLFALEASYGPASAMASLSRAVASAMDIMDIPGVCQCLAAFLAGDCSAGELPIRPSAEFRADLFDCAGHVLCALLSRATALGLSTKDAQGAAAETVAHLQHAWDGAVGAFFNLLQAHLDAKMATLRSAKIEDEIEAVRREVPVLIIRAMLPHVSEEQKKALITRLQAFN